MSIDEIKEFIQGGEWCSIATELRPEHHQKCSRRCAAILLLKVI